VSTGIEVIATGARTPLGLTAESTAAAVRAGISAFGEFPFVMANGEPVIVCADPQLESALQGRARMAALIESVLDEVLQKLAQGTPHDGRCYLLLALPETRPGFSEDDAAWVSKAAASRLEAQLHDVRVSVSGRGHAGAMRAIQLIAQEPARAADALFLIVGADSYHHPATFIWLEQNRRFAQPAIRSGFIPGEGAACLALCSSDVRAAMRLPTLALVGGVGLAQEALLRDSETGSFGAGITDAVLAATQGLQFPRDAVDTAYSDINGERYRSEEWGFLAMRTPSLWKSLEYEAPGSCWGDVGAAFAPLAASLAIQSYQRGYARGPRSMVMAASDSGLRGAMLLQDARLHSHG
jgi:3-oxoacyl-[acyl-carrier-protein] synthase I